METSSAVGSSARLLFVVNPPEFFVSHRLPLALAARAAGFEVHVASSDDDAIGSISAAGIPLHRIRLSRSGMNPLREARTLWELVRLMRRLRPRIVHLVTIKPVLYGGLASRIAQIHGVVVAISGLGHVFTAEDFRTRIVRKLVSATYRHAIPSRAVVIVQNKSNYGVLLRAGAIRNQRTVLLKGSGVDLVKYQLTAEQPGSPTVVFASRLLATKGVYEFVAAAERILSSGMTARFVLAGTVDTGNPAAVPQSDLERWQKSGAVEVLGHCSDVAGLFGRSHIVVLPSYAEGFPKVLMEAAACGRAVVTTDVPGCRDAIEPGLSGLLVPPGDVDALTAAISALLSDPIRRRQMGLAGRALAEREFAVENNIAKQLEIYSDLAAC